MPDLANRTDHEETLAAALLAALHGFTINLANGSPDFAALEVNVRAAAAEPLAVTNVAAYTGLWGTIADAPPIFPADVQEPARMAARQHAGALGKAMADARREQYGKLRQTAAEFAQGNRAEGRSSQELEAVALLWLIYGLNTPTQFRPGDDAQLRRFGLAAGGTGDIGGLLTEPPPGLRGSIPGEGRGWVDTWLGQETAKSVAITEVTRATTQAERAATKRYSDRTGVTLLAFWTTENDARVCPICMPLNDKPEASWDSKFPLGPPAHPRCRCWITWRKP